MVNLATQLGGSIGIALLDVFIDRRHDVPFRVLGANATTVQPRGPAVLAARGNVDALSGLVNGQAAILAYADATFAIAIVCFVCIPLVLLMRKPKAPTARSKSAAESFAFLPLAFRSALAREMRIARNVSGWVKDGVMGRTIAEKILGAHSGTEARAGEIVIAWADAMMAHDARLAQTMATFANWGCRDASKETSCSCSITTGRRRRRSSPSCTARSARSHGRSMRRSTTWAKASATI